MRAVAVTAIVFALVAPTGTLAQQPSPAPAAPAAPAAPNAPAPGAAPRPVQPATPATPVTSAQAPRPVTRVPAPAPPPGTFVTVEPNQPGQLVNIQLDIVLVIEGGAEAPSRKTVTLTLADKQEGSVRSIDRGPGSQASGPGSQASLNVDARPTMQANGKVLTRIGLEFQSGTEVPFVQVRAQPLLESGKALRVGRAISPKGDRSVTVEVTATVLK